MKTFLTILVLTFLSSPSMTAAQDVELMGLDSHFGYCDGIESTAQALKCVTKHKKDAETALLDNTNTVIENMDDDNLFRFQQVQNKWLEYRSAECAYEADRVAASGLKQITELSCLAEKTQARADEILQNDMRASQPEQFSEFGVFPRWLNSIKNTYPDVLWANNNVYSVDMSCDGSDEKIVSGYKYNPVATDINGEAADAEATVRYELAHFLAIARNPVVGKPEITVFEIPVKARDSVDTEGSKTDETEAASTVLCSKEINYAVFAEDVEKTEKSETPLCAPIVEITSGQSEKCKPLYLTYNNNQFGLSSTSPASETEEITEETKETGQK